MKPVVHIIAIFMILCLCIAATGCFGERLALTDILVSKYDPSGHHIWSTTIDSGKQDYATGIIETSDGGYAIAGWIADEPRAPVHPRVIMLDSEGGILWDRTLGSSQDEAVAIIQSKSGGYTVALKYGSIHHLDESGLPVWNRTFNHSIQSMIPTREGGYAIAGGQTFGIGENGTLLWDQPYTSTSILQDSDGGFYVEKSGVPYTFGTLFRLDSNHSLVWSHTLGKKENGKITSMHEIPEGTIEVVYTYPDRTKDKDLIQYMESERVSFDRAGNPAGSTPLVAVDPLTRTTDGGYAFLAYPFPGSAAFTSFSQAYDDLHLVRLSSEGIIMWDTLLDLGQWKAPQSVLQTRDGGFISLVVLGS